MGKKLIIVLMVILLITIVLDINNLYAMTIMENPTVSTDMGNYVTDLWVWKMISIIPIILLSVINYCKSSNYKKSMVINIISISFWLISIIIVPKQYIVSGNTMQVLYNGKTKLMIGGIVYIIALIILIISLILNVISKKRINLERREK